MPMPSVRLNDACKSTYSGISSTGKPHSLAFCSSTPLSCPPHPANTVSPLHQAKNAVYPSAKGTPSVMDSLASGSFRAIGDSRFCLAGFM